MKYLHRELPTGKILGWYSLDVHKKIPEGCIEIEDRVWQQVINSGFNCYKHSKFSIQDFTDKDELYLNNLEKIKNFILEELQWADVQLNYTLDQDKRATLTESVLRSYRRECRDYVEVVDGVSTISDYTLTRPIALLKKENKK